jgi:hypothetical protein
MIFESGEITKGKLYILLFGKGKWLLSISFLINFGQKQGIQR